MTEFIPGKELSRGFFAEAAQPLLQRYFPDLRYSAGLLGYGSDVLGYDDAISADHMWGPRFYLFLAEKDMPRREEILRVLGDRLPCTYRGYSVHFTEPDENDNGVRHPRFIEKGPVSPLIFVSTWPEFLRGQLGTAEPDSMTAAQWLAVSEHRLLSVAAGEFWHDGLGCAADLAKLRFYPDGVRLYLIASQWDILASEQAFVGRCTGRGDETGTRILAARMCERLMRLCFLYRGQYAPYPKWFGTAFARLDVPNRLRAELRAALGAADLTGAELHLLAAQLETARLHNESGLAEPVECRAESYYGRPMQVIFAERLAESAARKLRGTALEGVPLIGSFSQIGGLSEFSDDPGFYSRIGGIYRK